MKKRRWGAGTMGRSRRQLWAVVHRKQARAALGAAFGVIAALVITALLAIPHLTQEPVEAVGKVESAPVSTAEPTPLPEEEAKPVQHPDALLVLVNGNTALPEHFALTTRSYGGVEVNTLMYTDLCAMLDAAAEEGHVLWLASGYRSVKTQTNVLEKAVQSRMRTGMTREEAYTDARKTIQAPGHSEHHTGLAIDFNEVDYSFEESGAYAWLREHAAEYGFVERYPKDKAEITGIAYEPWHYRYVGREHAVRMQALGMCLEEYVAYCIAAETQ